QITDHTSLGSHRTQTTWNVDSAKMHTGMMGSSLSQLTVSLGNGFSQVVNRHGVKLAAVVAGDGFKVLQTNPELRILFSFKPESQGAIIVDKIPQRFKTTSTQFVDTMIQSQALGQHFCLRVLCNARATDNGCIPLPAVTSQIIGDATNRIDRIVPDVDETVSIKIHGIGAIAGRHELPVAHGSRVGTGKAQRLLFLL